MKCSVCETEFEAKRSDAKYCSNACRLKAKRDTHKGAVTQVIPKSDPTNPLSDTDKLFDNSYPGYYRFGSETYERNCLTCETKFKTRLLLLKFCSPDCRGDGVRKSELAEKSENKKEA